MEVAEPENSESHVENRVRSEYLNSLAPLLHLLYLHFLSCTLYNFTLQYFRTIEPSPNIVSALLFSKYYSMCVILSSCIQLYILSWRSSRRTFALLKVKYRGHNKGNPNPTSLTESLILVRVAPTWPSHTMEVFVSLRPSDHMGPEPTNCYKLRAVFPKMCEQNH